jgi:signal transduction histidine kinase/ligand-binding sensor domain-containing protein
MACMLSVGLQCAFALDSEPALDFNHYGHTAWRIRDAFGGRAIRAFAQTPDGYLWLGTEGGLQRFDGVRSLPWQLPTGMALPDERVRILRVARDRTLWIGTFAGVASWAGGKLNTYPALKGKIISDIVEDRDGTVWVSAIGAAGILCSIRGDDTQCLGQDGRFGAWTTGMYEDGKGVLWVAAANGLWRWKPGPPKQYALPISTVLQPLSETGTGAILAVTRNGIMQIDDDNVSPFAIPDLPADVEALALLRDRDGALWVGTSAGVLRVDAGQVAGFARADGLSGAGVYKLFEDREGNMWAWTMDGIDRFRPVAAATYGPKQGPPGSVYGVLADRDGDIWLAIRGRLHRWHGGRNSEDAGEGLPDRSVGSLFQDSRGRIWLQAFSQLGYLENGRFVAVKGVPGGYIDEIGEDRHGNLWVAHRDAGLLRLSSDLEVQRFPWTQIGQSGRSRLAVDPADGAVWLGFHSGVIVQFVDGSVRASYTARDGLGKGNVNQLRIGPDGAVWAATDGGLSRFNAGRFATLDHASGLPCDRVEASIVDDDASTWLYMGCGLVRIARADLDAWSAAAEQGMVLQRIRTTVLDASDGVRSVTALGGSPRLAKSPDGKLWLATNDGVTVVDPRKLHLNELPPPVRVERLVADRKAYDVDSDLHLPPLVRDLDIEYTALSFVAPERIRFRYKLEGRDPDWRDAGNRRMAVYSDLGPGNYRFRLIASNNSGVWNEEGSTVDFSIAPVYWQTTWFRALCAAVLFALLWGLYRLRVGQLARRFDLVLEARVNERNRIARDLHDTLLQSFHGLLLHLHTVAEMLPGGPAKQRLASAIDQAAEAITEGRDAVQDLRDSTSETNDLAAAIRTVAEELAVKESGSAAVIVNIDVSGASRILHPIVRDEVSRIASEALRNAFRHAAARRIEVEIGYDERGLRVRVRDDGRGIDPEILKAGAREGHFGLPGMRERARLAGGELTVWSAPDAGTEVEVMLPAARAYAASPAPGWRARLTSVWKWQRASGDR